MNARLIWELVDKGKVGYKLGAILLATFLQGFASHTLVFVVIIGLMAFLPPDGDPFRTLGLSRADYNLQRRIEIGVQAAIVAICFILIQKVPWLVVIGFIAVAIAVLIPNFRMPDRSAGRFQELAALSEGRTDDGWFPQTVEGQIIIRPQVRGWIFLSGGYCVVGLFLLLAHLIFGVNWDNGTPVIIYLASMFMIFSHQSTVNESLNEYVRFGGSRMVWVKHTALINAVIPGAFVLAGLAIPGWGMLSIMGAMFLLTFLVLITLGLNTGTSWKIAVPTVAALVVLVGYLIYQLAQENYGLPTILGVIGYVFGVLALLVIVKQANIQAGGLTRWLGLSPVKA